MQKVLITGSSGFLGRHLIKYSPQDISLIAHYCQNSPQGYGHRIQLFRGDFRSDTWGHIEKLNPQVIIHTAAMASLDDCESHPDLAWKTNYEASCSLADLAKSLSSRFIFISSDVVFDGKKGNYGEKHRPHPINVYAETKRSAETYILKNHSNAVVIRPALFYGLALNGRSSFTEIMLTQLRAGRKVQTFTDQYRTPILVYDLVSAIWELVNHDYCGLIHLGGPQKLNRHEMGKILCEIFNLDTKLLIPMKSNDFQMKAIRPLDCSLNSSRASNIIKTRILDYETGIRLAFQ